MVKLGVGCYIAFPKTSSRHLWTCCGQWGWTHIWHSLDMGVSVYGDTDKWMIHTKKSIENGWVGGYPPTLGPPIWSRHVGKIEASPWPCDVRLARGRVPQVSAICRMKTWRTSPPPPSRRLDCPEAAKYESRAATGSHWQPLATIQKSIEHLHSLGFSQIFSASSRKILGYCISNWGAYISIGNFPTFIAMV